MGLLADVFVATPAAAREYELAQLLPPHVASTQYQFVRMRGFTDIDFSYLWAILAGGRWDAGKHGLEACQNAAVGVEALLKESGASDDFAALYEQVAGKKPDWSARHSDSTLHQFPRDYVALLAGVPNAEERRIAAKWRSALKRRSRCDLGETQMRNILLRLRSLAKHVDGSRKRKRLYLWTSL